MSTVPGAAAASSERRRPVRIRVLESGQVEMVDPGLDAAALLSSIDPQFQIPKAPLPGFGVPRIRASKAHGIGLAQEQIRCESTERLWALHEHALQARRASGPATCPAMDEASLLDLKAELAQRLLEDCSLCAHRCGVNRLQGALGACRLGPEAYVAERFVHIAEEPPINPSLVLSLTGCGLRCRYCQQGEILDPAKAGGESLADLSWDAAEHPEARSMSFVGGNPDESLAPVLAFLGRAPADFGLPLVWNTHGYSTPETLSLLDGVVDVYVPDLKYGSKGCAVQLSGAPGYPDVALRSIEEMLRQQALVIVRLLVLPGHFRCCHEPALEALARIAGPNLRLSIRDQYAPDWRIDARDGALARRPYASEIAEVRDRAERLGLLDVAR